MHYIPVSCTSSPCNLLILGLGVYSLVQATVGVGTVLIWDFCVAFTRAGGYVLLTPAHNLHSADSLRGRGCVLGGGGALCVVFIARGACDNVTEEPFLLSLLLCCLQFCRVRASIQHLHPSGLSPVVLRAAPSRPPRGQSRAVLRRRWCGSPAGAVSARSRRSHLWAALFPRGGGGVAGASDDRSEHAASEPSVPRADLRPGTSAAGGTAGVSARLCRPQMLVVQIPRGMASMTDTRSRAPAPQE